MPRTARLDAPGVLHHVMGRGLDRQVLFRDDQDRDDFVRRLAGLAEVQAVSLYAWALLPTHFHLLLQTGTRPLARSMRALLTGGQPRGRDRGDVVVFVDLQNGSRNPPLLPASSSAETGKADPPGP